MSPARPALLLPLSQPLPRRLLLRQSVANGLTLVAGSSSVALAQARASEAPALAPEVRQVLPQARWSGTARLRFLGQSIYEATLWVEPGFSARHYERQALALELQYFRDLAGRDIAQRSLAEMRRQGDFSPAQAQVWLAAMQRAFPDVKTGERITGLHQPDTGARFWHQGSPTASVPDVGFSRLFFGIWLAEVTSEPKLRSALLARSAP